MDLVHPGSSPGPPTNFECANHLVQAKSPSTVVESESDSNQLNGTIEPKPIDALRWCHHRQPGFRGGRAEANVVGNEIVEVVNQ